MHNIIFEGKSSSTIGLINIKKCRKFVACFCFLYIFKYLLKSLFIHIIKVEENHEIVLPII